METSAAAKLLSQKAAKARAREREFNCRACGKLFSARSARAQYCSKSCANQTWYFKDEDELFRNLTHIQEITKGLIGRDKRIDSTLKRILQLIFLAKSNHRVKTGRLPLE